MPLSKSNASYQLLREIYRFARHKKISLFIVGGALRDMLLLRQKENPDIDFCLQNGAINFGRLLARKMRAGFVVLDKERGYCRLVKKMEPPGLKSVVTRGGILERPLPVLALKGAGPCVSARISLNKNLGCSILGRESIDKNTAG